MTPPRTPCRIKVCGITDPSEAAALDALGIDWLGFNFHPKSPRFIAPEDAAPIIKSLKRSVPVGVFVDADPARVRAAAAVSGIRMAQLHGSETWDMVAGMPLPVIKAVPHDRLADLGGIKGGLDAAASPAPLAYLLVDTRGQMGPGGSGFGGTGAAFDWGLLGKHPPPLPFFLAGGLGPHNLEAAVASAHPFAVDLNSKVETAPGRKDLAKIGACMAILKKLI